MNNEQLVEKAIRLLQMRAGGRYTTFESGMLYQICLDLGMKDERKGGVGKQEEYWEQIICSCWGAEQAGEALKNLLKNEKIPTRKERSEMRKIVEAKET